MCLSVRVCVCERGCVCEKEGVCVSGSSKIKTLSSFFVGCTAFRVCFE